MLHFLFNQDLWTRVLSTLLANGILALLAWVFHEAIINRVMKKVHDFNKDKK